MPHPLKGYSPLYQPFSAITLGHVIEFVTEDTSCPKPRILAPRSKSFGQSLRIRP
ncbi:hypothetical protein PIB30_067485 [Stylosanthes scabra]|uniref:Uncharacterized protein n=1 Tax=Stylosanthes scabra TaxID=79078 RepID=A0ABU6XP11_9FABA|nr:hypothetical protein [Stylosanthes scabra]